MVIAVTTGSRRAERLDGTDLQDVIIGRSGDDTLSGGGNRDLLLGNLGNDVLSGDDAPDSLEGGRGDDALVGGSNNDRLLGGDCADTLSGGDAGDVLFGGRGKDVLAGGAGRDQFYFGRVGFGEPRRVSGDDDVIVDFESDRDILWIDGRRGPRSIDDLTITQNGDDVVISYEAFRTTSTIRLVGVDAAELSDNFYFYSFG